MPIDSGTRGSKHQIDGMQPTSIDTSKAQSIVFAPNITPWTFNDPPSLVNPPFGSRLFHSTPDFPSGKRQMHGKKKPGNHIPRPPNAFILFRSSFINSKHVSADVETSHSMLSKIIGLTWHNLPHEEHQIWHIKAKIALEEHRRRYPQYAFRPLQTKGKGNREKRKVREVVPKDMKRCVRIAELLTQGLKGEELNAAIVEFDRNHVPEIVTRFVTPITARTYRRSFSAPASDIEYLKPAGLKTSSLEARALGTEPTASTQTDYESSGPWKGDAETNHYQIYSPISPVTSPTCSVSGTNPSFDFRSFSLNIPADLAPFESFDPCFNLSNSQESVHNVFSLEGSTPYNFHTDSFALSTISVDTSFLDDCASSSPIPGISNMHNSSVPQISSDVMSIPMEFEPSFEFLTDLSTYSTDLAPSMPNDFSIHALPEYNLDTDSSFLSF